jgi:hypothetical protein
VVPHSEAGQVAQHSEASLVVPRSEECQCRLDLATSRAGCCWERRLARARLEPSRYPRVRGANPADQRRMPDELEEAESCERLELQSSPCMR